MGLASVAMGNTCFKSANDPLGVGERYRLEELIGGGSGGEVWAATEKSSQTKVALKFISVKGARNWEVVIDAGLSTRLSHKCRF